jgi:hypothetical protein
VSGSEGTTRGTGERAAQIPCRATVHPHNLTFARSTVRSRQKSSDRIMLVWWHSPAARKKRSHQLDASAARTQEQ